MFAESDAGGFGSASMPFPRRVVDGESGGASCTTSCVFLSPPRSGLTHLGDVLVVANGTTCALDRRRAASLGVELLGHPSRHPQLFAPRDQSGLHVS